MLPLVKMIVVAMLAAQGLAPRARDDWERTTAKVGPAVYHPLYASSDAEKAVPVRAFRLDRRPVTNGELAAFISEHPEWARDKVARALAEERYLARWAAPDAPGDAALRDRRATDVSWFAARAYCAWRGMRLPTEAEWEVAAAASPRQKDGARDPAWRAALVVAYAKAPGAELPADVVAPNAWGIEGLHGEGWEWVLDFDAAVGIGDAEGPLRFCAGGAGTARDDADFPNFERVALRTSLRAPYTLENLGFRCAADAPGDAP